MSEHQGDGTVTWSLSLLKQALRQAPDGLPYVSTYTIQRILREAGYRWQKNRGWYESGQVKHKRKAGMATGEANDPLAYFLTLATTLG
jgi:transposase